MEKSSHLSLCKDYLGTKVFTPGQWKKGIFLSPKMEETIQATSAEVNTIVHIPPHCDI